MVGAREVPELLVLLAVVALVENQIRRVPQQVTVLAVAVVALAALVNTVVAGVRTVQLEPDKVLASRSMLAAVLAAEAGKQPPMPRMPVVQAALAVLI